MNSATKDPEVVKKWFSAYPDINYAVAGGDDSNLSFYDYDDLYDDDTNVDYPESQFSGLHKSFRVRSGRLLKSGQVGGFHLYAVGACQSRALFADAALPLITRPGAKKDGLPLVDKNGNPIMQTFDRHDRLVVNGRVTIGEVRSRGEYVIGYGSHHKSGRDYELVVDAPLFPNPIQDVKVVSNTPAIGTDQQNEIASYVEEGLGKAKIEYKTRQDYQGGFKWLITCPWEHEHTGGKTLEDGGSSSAVFMAASGALGYRCLHAHCQSLRNWEQFRTYLESIVGHRLPFSPSGKPPYASETFVEPGTSPTPPVENIHLAYAGIKDMPESVLDGWLGQICKSRMLEHFPVAYAWTALVTVASAMVPVEPKNGMRCNLFGCPVGPIHSGKSEAIKHAKLLLGIQSPPLLDLFAGSAEMLTSAVADANGRPRLYSTDELGHLLEKAQIQNSSFVYLLNRAFYETGFTVRSMEKKKKEVIFNAILSVIGGVVEERFGDLFTAKTTGGFYDRFLYGLCPTGFRYFYMPFEGGPALQISQTEDDPYSEAIVPIASVGNQPIPVALDKSVFVEANRWMRDDDVLKNPDCERIVEIAMRVATICASFDRRPILYGKDLGPALELARYQARIRHLLKPNPGKTFEGQLYHKFFEFLTMHTSDGSWVSRKELFHRTCSHEIGLPVANKTLDAMIANEDVEGLDQRGKSGPPKRLVRIARKTKVQP